MLVRVTLRDFCAGFVIEGNRITQCAPILAWLKRQGRSGTEAIEALHRMSWVKVELLADERQA